MSNKHYISKWIDTQHEIADQQDFALEILRGNVKDKIAPALYHHLQRKIGEYYFPKLEEVRFRISGIEGMIMGDGEFEHHGVTASFDAETNHIHYFAGEKFLGITQVEPHESWVSQAVYEIDDRTTCDDEDESDTEAG